MKGELRVLDRTGDTVTEWDTTDKPSVKAANKEFERLVAEGHLTYTLSDEQDRRGEVLKKFDPEAGTIYATQRPVGG